MFKLIIEDDEGHTTVVPLVKDEITIGRKEGNTIRLTERNVSRHHARLLRSNGAFLIEDLDSYNGVKVNGDRITTRTTIREGDLVEIGDYHLALQKTAEAESPPPVSGTSPPALPSSQPTQSDGATAILRLPVDKKEAAGAARARPVPQQQVGHLQVISTELAGQSFALQRTEMTIGRTTDNDIVVAHRSVSAQHAKIVFDNGVYRVIDMDSANGVLVNGEEYARVDLRSGDVIELGHVKMRFVPAGEPLPEVLPDTSPQPRAQVAAKRPERLLDKEVFRPRGGRGKLLALGAGGLLAAILAVVLLWPSAEPPPQADSGAEEHPPPAATTAKANPSQEAARLYKEGLEKFRQREFTAARVILQAAQKADPQYPGVETMLAQVLQAEKDSQLLTQARQAMDQQQWDDAWNLLKQINQNGPFDTEVKPLQEEVRKKVIIFHLNKAHLAMKSRDLLAVAENHLRKVEEVDPGNRMASRLRKQISKLRAPRPQVASARPRAPQKPSRPPRALRGDAWKQVGLTKKELARLRKQNPRKAIRLLQRVIEINPRDCDALSQLGACYTIANEAIKGYEYYKRFVRLCPRHTLVPQVRLFIKQFEESKLGVQK